MMNSAGRLRQCQFPQSSAPPTRLVLSSFYPAPHSRNRRPLASDRPGALFPQPIEKTFDHRLHFEPGCGIIRLKDRKGSCLLRRLFDHVEEPSDRNITPLVVIAGQRACAPDQRPFPGKRTDGVNRFSRVGSIFKSSWALSVILATGPITARQTNIRWRFPHPTLADRPRRRHRPPQHSAAAPPAAGS